MTDLLYIEDMRKKEFKATVVAAEGRNVELTATLFYPSSGGVEGDTGTIARGNDVFKVVSTRKDKGRVLHEVDRDGLAGGDEVAGTIDWDRRYLLMRYHTSAHVISGVFARTYKAKITGNQLTPAKGRIDFSLETFDKAVIDAAIKEANEIISRDLQVRTYTMKRADVEANPEMCKLAMGLPPGIEELRIVDIVGFDAQPDGGCHVEHLGEVGKIEFVSTENKGKANRRVYYVLK